MRVGQWQVLRHLAAGEKTAGELATALSRQISSVRRSLDALGEQGLVTFRAFEGDQRTGRGIPSGWWSLTESGVGRAQTPLDSPGRIGRAQDAAESGANSDSDSDGDEERVGPWEIARHQSFAMATVESTRLSALLDVLALGEHGAEASFVVRLDADGHDYLFVFDPRLGARPAETLAVALNAAGIPCTAGSVADVRGLGAMVSDALAASTAAAGARKRLE